MVRFGFGGKRFCFRISPFFSVLKLLSGFLARDCEPLLPPDDALKCVKSGACHKRLYTVSRHCGPK